MSDNVCFYHGPHCADGIVAAWAVWKFLKGNVELVPVDYHTPIPEIPDNKIVWVVDFTFPDPLHMVELIKKSRMVHHFDHHITAERTISALCKKYQGTGKYRSVYSQSQSGAGLVWRSLFDGVAPNLVQWVEDRDLWLFTLKDTKAFGEGFSALPRTIGSCEYANLPENQQTLIEKGRAAIAERFTRCRYQISQTMQTVTVKDQNGEDTSVKVTKLTRPEDASEQTHLMVNLNLGDIVMAYSELDDGRLKFRVCTPQHNPVAHLVAKQYGGGGHPHAAGFVLDAKEAKQLGLSV